MVITDIRDAFTLVISSADLFYSLPTVRLSTTILPYSLLTTSYSLPPTLDILLPRRE